MKSKNITVSSVILAISFIFLYLSSVMPTSKLACLCVATTGICIIIIESGAKWGFLSAVVLSVLGWFLLPDKTVSILFILFFSYYPLIKLFAEKKGRLLEWIIKIIYFCIITAIGIFVLNTAGALPEVIRKYLKNIPMLVSIGFGIVAMGAVFDFALSIVIGYYTQSIMPKIKRN